MGEVDIPISKERNTDPARNDLISEIQAQQGEQSNLQLVHSIGSVLSKLAAPASVLSRKHGDQWCLVIL